MTDQMSLYRSDSAFIRAVLDPMNSKPAHVPDDDMTPSIVRAQQYANIYTIPVSSGVMISFNLYTPDESQVVTIWGQDPATGFYHPALNMAPNESFTQGLKYAMQRAYAGAIEVVGDTIASGVFTVNGSMIGAVIQTPLLSTDANFQTVSSYALDDSKMAGPIPLANGLHLTLDPTGKLNFRPFTTPNVPGTALYQFGGPVYPNLTNPLVRSARDTSDALVMTFPNQTAYVLGTGGTLHPLLDYNFHNYPNQNTPTIRGWVLLEAYVQITGENNTLVQFQLTLNEVFAGANTYSATPIAHNFVFNASLASGTTAYGFFSQWVYISSVVNEVILYVQDNNALAGTVTTVCYAQLTAPNYYSVNGSQRMGIIMIQGASANQEISINCKVHREMVQFAELQRDLKFDTTEYDPRVMELLSVLSQNRSALGCPAVQSNPEFRMLVTSGRLDQTSNPRNLVGRLARGEAGFLSFVPPLLQMALAGLRSAATVAAPYVAQWAGNKLTNWAASRSSAGNSAFDEESDSGVGLCFFDTAPGVTQIPDFGEWDNDTEPDDSDIDVDPSFDFDTQQERLDDAITDQQHDQLFEQPRDSWYNLQIDPELRTILTKARHNLLLDHYLDSALNRGQRLEVQPKIFHNRVVLLGLDSGRLVKREVIPRENPVSHPIQPDREYWNPPPEVPTGNRNFEKIFEDEGELLEKHKKTGYYTLFKKLGPQSLHILRNYHSQRTPPHILFANDPDHYTNNLLRLDRSPRSTRVYPVGHCMFSGSGEGYVTPVYEDDDHYLIHVMPSDSYHLYLKKDNKLEFIGSYDRPKITLERIIDKLPKQTGKCMMDAEISDNDFFNNFGEAGPSGATSGRYGDISFQTLGGFAPGWNKYNQYDQAFNRDYAKLLKKSGIMCKTTFPYVVNNKGSLVPQMGAVVVSDSNVYIRRAGETGTDMVFRSNRSMPVSERPEGAEGDFSLSVFTTESFPDLEGLVNQVLESMKSPLCWNSLSLIGHPYVTGGRLNLYVISKHPLEGSSIQLALLTALMLIPTLDILTGSPNPGKIRGVGKKQQLAAATQRRLIVLSGELDPEDEDYPLFLSSDRYSSLFGGANKTVFWTTKADQALIACRFLPIGRVSKSSPEYENVSAARQQAFEPQRRNLAVPRVESSELDKIKDYAQRYKDDWTLPKGQLPPDSTVIEVVSLLTGTPAGSVKELAKANIDRHIGDGFQKLAKNVKGFMQQAATNPTTIDARRFMNLLKTATVMPKSAKKASLSEMRSQYF